MKYSIGSIPPGIILLDKTCCNCHSKNVWCRIWVWLLTFLCYVTYHLSRKPISVVKEVLHWENCSVLPGYNKSDPYACDWAPFDHDNFEELEGSLDYAFLFAYALGMFVCGHIAERMNLRLYLALGMMLSGVTTALFGLGYYGNIHSLTYYVAVQIAGGLVQASGWPGVVTCVGNWFGKGHRGLVFGVWNSHTSVGNILGSVIATIWITKELAPPWGMSFIVPGFIIFSMGIFVFFFLPTDPTAVDCLPPNHKGKSIMNHTVQRADEALLDPGVTDSALAHVPPATEHEPLLSSDSDSDKENVQILQKPAISFWGACTIPGVVEFSFCLFFAKLVSYTFLYWLPLYIKNITNYGASKSAYLSTMFDVGGIIGGIMAGVISDYTGKSATTCVIMLFFSAPMLFIYQAYGHLGLKLNIFLLIVTGMLVNGPYALITTAVSADLGTHKSLHDNAKALATVTAIIDGTGSMGAALGPLLAGLISPTGWNNVFYMLIASDVIALVLLLRRVVKETCCRPRDNQYIAL